MSEQHCCLAIGDVHGRPFWKRYLDRDFAEFFILGDYFDSYSYSYKKEMANFREIIAAARADSRIKLLLGNHDYHYLADDCFERYSRFQERPAPMIRAALNEAADLFQIVYTRGDLLISHAGVSQTFMDLHGFKSPEEINAAFRADKGLLRFVGTDPYGDDTTQGPFWLRPKSLLSDPLVGWNQLVGHTPVEQITTTACHDKTGAEHSVTFIDTFETESIYHFAVTT
jgi:hypothetical protein